TRAAFAAFAALAAFVALAALAALAALEIMLAHELSLHVGLKAEEGTSCGSICAFRRYVLPPGGVQTPARSASPRAILNTTSTTPKPQQPGRRRAPGLRAFRREPLFSVAV